ncbi:MAG: phosphopyruvate hydratase, partial [Candidatus Korarchaeota archaeon]
GNPTVEADVILKNGIIGRAAVPSGASTGMHEALELRDKEKEFHGKGVKKAISNIFAIGEKIKGMNPTQQEQIDRIMIELDGTPNKSNFGANAILAVSLATARAAAQYKEMELFQYIGQLCGIKNPKLFPLPFSNIINGGKHAGNGLSIQEFMIVPIGAKTFPDAVRMLSETYHALKSVLTKVHGPVAQNVGDEGGFAPPISVTTEALDAIMLAIDEAGYSPGKDIALALDAAASEFFDSESGTYKVDGQSYDTDGLIDFYKGLVRKYPIISIEDPLEENDFEGFSKVTSQLKIQIVGDDIFVTQKPRLELGIKNKSGNAILIKLNQVGTLTETIEVVKLAKENEWNAMVSHRSGETEDTFIADLAVGLETGQIKTGAPARGERTAKYNRLLRIWELLGECATMATLK